MILDATSIPSLAEIIGGRAEQAERPHATDVLVGFDAAVQFSRPMLQAQLASSLAQRRLSSLAADGVLFRFPERFWQSWHRPAHPPCEKHGSNCA